MADIKLYDRTDDIEIVFNNSEVIFIPKDNLNARGERYELVLYRESNEDAEGTESVVRRIPFVDVVNGSYDGFVDFISHWYDILKYYRTVEHVVKHQAHITEYDQLLTVEETTLLDIKSNYGISFIRDADETTGNGSLTHNGHEYRLSSASGAVGTSALTTKERGVYITGKIARVGIAFREVSPPKGGASWSAGAYSDNNGFRMEKDKDGISLIVEKGGSESERIYQQNWNIDKMNGKGPSGEILDPQEGVVFNVYYAYYGYGPIIFVVWKTDHNFVQRMVVIHRTKFDGELSVNNPNLPIKAEVSSTNSSDGDVEISVTGRHFSILGKFDPPVRETTGVRNGITIGTTLTNVMSFKRSSDFNGVTGRLSGLDIITNEDCLLYFFIVEEDPSGSSFGVPAEHLESDTAFLIDTSSTSIPTKRHPITVAEIKGGERKSESGKGGKFALNVNIPNSDILLVAAKTMTGSSTTTFRATIRIAEEW